MKTLNKIYIGLMCLIGLVHAPDLRFVNTDGSKIDTYTRPGGDVLIMFPVKVTDYKSNSLTRPVDIPFNSLDTLKVTEIGSFLRKLDRVDLSQMTPEQKKPIELTKAVFSKDMAGPKIMEFVGPKLDKLSMGRLSGEESEWITLTSDKNDLNTIIVKQSTLPPGLTTIYCSDNVQLKESFTPITETMYETMATNVDLYVHKLAAGGLCPSMQSGFRLALGSHMNMINPCVPEELI